MKNSIGNPAVSTALIKATDVLPWLIKFAVVGTTGYLIYRSYSNRFQKLKEVSNYPAANISFAQAQSRADAISGSISLFSNDINNVANQLTGLNYNGFIRVYNAFGKKKGTYLGGDLNLVEWLQNQFNKEQLQELSFLLNGAFFRTANPTKNITNTSLGNPIIPLLQTIITLL